MNYAYPSNKPFYSSKPVDRKAVLTQEMQERRDFIKGHKVSIHFDKQNNNLVAEVNKR